jgi:hypothetical protein
VGAFLRGVIIAVVACLLSACASAQALSFDGPEQAPAFVPLDVKSEHVADAWLSAKQLFRKDGDFALLKLKPKNIRSDYYTAFSPVAVDGMARYTLATRINLEQGGGSLHFSATFLKDGHPLRRERLLAIYRHPREKYTVRMIERAVDFATPQGADQMVLWLQIRRAGKGSLKGKQAIFAPIQIRQVGPMNGTGSTRKLIGANLLPAGDFGKASLGPKSLKAMGFWQGKGIRGEIVDDDSRCLRIIMDKGGDKFVRFHTKPINFDNCWVEYSFRIKGKGKVTPGLWWHLRGNMWHYWHDHPKAVELNDQWQRVVVRQFCVDPSANYAACTFTVQSDEAEFFVDDVSLKILSPEGK